DPDLVRPLAQRLGKRYAGIHLKVKVANIEATAAGLRATFEGEKAPAPQIYDRGFIPTDKQMRTNVPHIFAIGDIVGNPMLAHKATHEGKVAAEVCAGQQSEFL